MPYAEEFCRKTHAGIIKYGAEEFFREEEKCKKDF